MPSLHQAWSVCWPWPCQCHRASSQPFQSGTCWSDIHNEHKCIIVFYLLHGWLGGQGELDDGSVVKLVSPGGAFLRRFRLPSEISVFSLGRWVVYCSVALDASQHCFLCLQINALEDESLPSSLLAPPLLKKKKANLSLL